MSFARVSDEREKCGRGNAHVAGDGRLDRGALDRKWPRERTRCVPERGDWRRIATLGQNKQLQPNCVVNFFWLKN